MPLLLRAGIVAVVVSSLGCAPEGKKVVPVNGTVTRSGKPVPNVTVHFRPDNGRPSWGKTDDSGRYSLNYDPQRNGAEVGPHRVFVELRPSSPDEDYRMKAGKLKLPADKQAITDKYGTFEKTPLRVDVTDAFGKRYDLSLD